MAVDVNNLVRLRHHGDYNAFISCANTLYFYDDDGEEIFTGTEYQLTPGRSVYIGAMNTGPSVTPISITSEASLGEESGVTLGGCVSGLIDNGSGSAKSQPQTVKFEYTFANARIDAIDDDTFFSGSNFTSLMASGFKGMFKGSTLRTIVQGLLGTFATIPEECFSEMFKDCSYLTLEYEHYLGEPVIVGKKGCYSMFDQCTNLEYPPVFTESVEQVSGSYAFSYMFGGCGLKALPKFQNELTYVNDCNSVLNSMFKGARFFEEISIDSMLPRNIIVNYCCQAMFMQAAFEKKVTLHLNNAFDLNGIALFEDAFWMADFLASGNSITVEDIGLPGQCFKGLIRSSYLNGNNCVITFKNIPLFDSECLQSMCSDIRDDFAISDSMFVNISEGVTVNDAAFRQMFENSNITSIPSDFFSAFKTLPTEACYKMFYRNSTYGPSVLAIDNLYLPATSVGNSCFEDAFVGAKIKNIEIEATTLDTNAFARAFKDNSVLEKLTVKFTDWDEEGSGMTEDWVDGVNTRHGTFIAPGGLTRTYDSSHIPAGWAPPILNRCAKLTNNAHAPITIAKDGLDFFAPDRELVSRNTFELPVGATVYFTAKNLGTVPTAGIAVILESATPMAENERVILGGTAAGLIDDGTGSQYGQALNSDLKEYFANSCITDLETSFLGKSFGNSTIAGLLDKMFFNSRLKTIVPVTNDEILLPYTNVYGSYADMFANCTDLTFTEGFVLGTPAKLRIDSAARMFNGCVKLTYIPIFLESVTSIDGTRSCSGIFGNCGELNNFPDMHNMVPTGPTKMASIFASAFSNDFFKCDINLTEKLPKAICNLMCSNAFVHSKIQGSVELEIDDSWTIYYGANNAFDSMFEDCEFCDSLKFSVKDTTLGTKEFYGMFYKAKFSSEPDISFNNIGNIPESCFENTFKEATGFINIPSNFFEGAEPENTVGKNAFKSMFDSCEDLETIPGDILVFNNLGVSACESMFYKCSKAVCDEFILPATSVGSKACYRMFADGPSVKSAKLDALTLTTSCFYEMFKGCAELERLEVAFEDWNEANLSTKDWVNGVLTKNKSFVSPASLTKIYDDDHIPTLWKEIYHGGSINMFGVRISTR